VALAMTVTAVVVGTRRHEGSGEDTGGQGSGEDTKQCHY